MKFKSRSDRFTGKLNGLRIYLKESLNEDTHKVLERVKKIVVGWVNYNAISDNQRQVSAFIHWSKRALFSWINRKGRKRRLSWVKFEGVLKRVKYPISFKKISMLATC